MTANDYDELDFDDDPTVIENVVFTILMLICLVASPFLWIGNQFMKLCKKMVNAVRKWAYEDYS